MQFLARAQGKVADKTRLQLPYYILDRFFPSGGSPPTSHSVGEMAAPLLQLALNYGTLLTPPFDCGHTLTTQELVAAVARLLDTADMYPTDDVRQSQFVSYVFPALSDLIQQPCREKLEQVQLGVDRLVSFHGITQPTP